MQIGCWEFTLVVLLSAIELYSAGAARAQEPHDTTATIAAWNLRAKPDPIDRTRAAEIARGIICLDAEVLAVSEVDPPEIVSVLVDELKRQGADYRATMPEQVSPLKLALLYKPGAEVSRVACLDEVNLGNPDHRKALVADVRIGRFDFHLVALHLKSGPGEEEQALRVRQAEMVARHIRDYVLGAEKDIVLLGDLNMTPVRDAGTFPILAADGYLRFISSQYLSRLGSHISNGRYGNLLDGYAISREHTAGEYIEGTLRVFPMNLALNHSLRDYEHRVSDHLPLVARFRITADDD